jgi:RNA polymerase sigma-70 factor (ECF subfamily)
VRFLYRRLGDRDQAEDLAQESFIRLLADRPRSPRAWLYSVALNLARDVERREKRRSQRLVILSADEAEPSDSGPEAAMAREEVAAHVRSALERLSERDRNILTLREEGLSYKEIAGVIGVSPTSMGPLLNRAQKRFLIQFEQQGKGTIDVETSG